MYVYSVESFTYQWSPLINTNPQRRSREVGDIRRLLKFDFVYSCICGTYVLNIQMVHSYPVGCKIYGMQTKSENQNRVSKRADPRYLFKIKVDSKERVTKMYNLEATDLGNLKVQRNLELNSIDKGLLSLLVC